MKWEFEAELALKSAYEAGAILTDVVIQQLDEKGSHKDIVTEYDLASSRVINQNLKNNSLYPFINEEFVTADAGQMKKPSTYWVVDPIDGTINFASGLPLFATSVGLVHEEEFVVGALYAPKMRDLYFTYRDQGNYLNGKRIYHKKVSSLKQASVAASFSNAHIDPILRKKQYEVFGEVNDSARSLLRLGSAALNIAFVSEGKLHGAYGMNAKIWDIGAALAIAKQAGCALYFEYVDAINLNYIVGSEVVVSEIKKILVGKGLLNEKK